jgi:riboflavin transporter
MKKFIALFVNSSKEMKKISCLTLIAMFGAISIVIGSFTIMIGDFLKVGFTFLPNNYVYYLFGPTVGVMYGAAIDILNYFVKPVGPFFFGFTVSSIVSGLIYGVLLYQKPPKLSRVFIANSVQTIIVKILLNTYWLSILYGKGFYAILPARALKDIIMLPIETILLFTIIKGVEASGVLKYIHGNKAKV